MTYNDYLSACKAFANDTQHWSYCPQLFYTTTGSPYNIYVESGDNASGGIDVSWAFKMSPEQVEKHAPQQFMDCCTELLRLVIDGDCDSDFLESIYSLFT